MTDNELKVDDEVDNPNDKDYHPNQESDYSNGEKFYTNDGNDYIKNWENGSYENQ